MAILVQLHVLRCGGCAFDCGFARTRPTLECLDIVQLPAQVAPGPPAEYERHIVAIRLPFQCDQKIVADVVAQDHDESRTAGNRFPRETDLAAVPVLDVLVAMRPYFALQRFDVVSTYDQCRHVGSPQCGPGPGATSDRSGRTHRRRQNASSAPSASCRTARRF
jgi:hypothetical protein